MASTSNTTNGSEAGSLICLTITAFRNPSLDEEEYRQYMTQSHARLVSPLMEEYGILRYTMVNTCSLTMRDLRPYTWTDTQYEQDTPDAVPAV
jgi:hypothetical protein